LITHPTKDELAKERGVDVDRIDEAEVQSVVVVGTELEKFTDKDWETVLSKPEIVFSRTSPQQKFTIVERIQERGQVIAMTGELHFLCREVV
jgi:sodium/potassium-transporting ATPase subunit alpha